MNDNCKLNYTFDCYMVYNSIIILGFCEFSQIYLVVESRKGCRKTGVLTIRTANNQLKKKQAFEFLVNSLDGNEHSL